MSQVLNARLEAAYLFVSARQSSRFVLPLRSIRNTMRPHYNH